MKKAQASLEQLFVIAMALAVVAVTFYLATAYSSDSLKISQAEDAVGRLSGSADYVYALGPNTREYVEVYLPQDITRVNISGRRIVLTVQTSGGTTDVFANAKADLVGALPSARGRQKVLVQYLETGKILIGQAGLACDPQFVSKAFNSSGSESGEIVVSNNADSEVTGVTSELSGSVTAIASIGSLPETIPKGASANLGIDFNVPPGQAPGTYTGTVVVDSENDGSCVVNLNVHVNRETSCAGLCLARGYDNGTCRAAPAMCVASGEDYVPENDYTCGVGAPDCCCGPTQDVLGPLVSMINASPENASTIDNVTITALCNDTATGASFIQSARVRIDDGAWADMGAVDGTFTHSVLEQVGRDVGKHTNGQHVAWVECTDAAGNRGPTSYLYFNVTMADVIGPIITFMNHTEYPTTLTNISMSGSATDYYTGNRNIKKCVVKVDDGAWVDAEPADGAYDSPTEDYYYNIGEMGVGYHDVYAQCIDVLNNSGGVYNQSFGVVSVDLMLVLDRSGSMAWNVTNVTSTAVVSTTNTGFTQVKSFTVDAKNGDLANISVEISASASGCTALFEVRVSGDVLASGNRTSTSYGYVYLNNVNISEYSTPFQLALYMKRSSSGSCTVYNRNFRIQQGPIKLVASKNAAKTFVDIVTESTNAGLVSYSTSATLDESLSIMSPANKNGLKSSIDAMNANGGTCIECGLESAANELTSARGRANATRVVILLTDGVSTSGNSVDGAVYCRDRNVTVYTIGLGSDVDDVELTNIALLTNGEYYFAPDAQTLTEIFLNIGK